MADIDITAIRARADAATNGRWNVVLVDNLYSIADDTRHRIVSIDANDKRYLSYDAKPYYPIYFGIATVEDARFIAHARDDVPALCDALEKAQAEIEDATSAWQVAQALLRAETEAHKKAQVEIERLRHVLDQMCDPCKSKFGK